MYLGRIVSAGMTKKGDFAAIYRVSSRSFPNREAKILKDSVSIIPKAGFEGDIRKNPYIAYNCAKIARNFAIVSNGSHTDPIAEKIAAGLPPRDALALTLLTMDYEKDSYNTPRIATVLNPQEKRAFLGIVRKDALLVSEINLAPGRLHYVSTYEHNRISDDYCDKNFDAANADEACEYILSRGIFENFEHPVASVCLWFGSKGLEISSKAV